MSAFKDRVFFPPLPIWWLCVFSYDCCDHGVVKMAMQAVCLCVCVCVCERWCKLTCALNEKSVKFQDGCSNGYHLDSIQE